MHAVRFGYSPTDEASVAGLTYWGFGVKLNLGFFEG